MPRDRAIFGVAILLALCPFLAFGQEHKHDIGKELGWDISYDELLKRNRVSSDEFAAKWLKETDRSFTRKLLAKWSGEKISESILIEHPAFHAGEHSVIWLTRTKDSAVVWQGVDKGDFMEKRQIDPKLF